MSSQVAVAPDPHVESSGPSLKRAGALAYVTTSLTLGVNVVTGILIARRLGASGRGEIAAITVATQLVAWSCALGCYQAVTYRKSRQPSDGARLLGTWLLILVPLSCLAVLVGEVLLPHLLAAQAAETLRLAQLYMLTAVFVLLNELIIGLLMGDRDFTFVNLMRLAQPMMLAGLLGALALTGGLTVESTVLATAFVGVLALAISGARALQKNGIARPSQRLTRSTMSYGLRAHVSYVGNVLNTRLDLLIMPALLSASSVGFYAVATNASWIIVSVSGALAALVFPAAAHDESGGIRIVLGSLKVTLGIAAAMALFLALLADPAVKLAFGEEFERSVLPLQLLLPGCVLYAAAGVLWSGLSALGRPFTAAVAQWAGTVVTVVGLLLFLKRGGITAAALVSSASYAIVFAVSLLFYARAAGVAVLEWATWRTPYVVDEVTTRT